MGKKPDIKYRLLPASICLYLPQEKKEKREKKLMKTVPDKLLPLPATAFATAAARGIPPPEQPGAWGLDAGGQGRFLPAPWKTTFSSDESRSGPAARTRKREAGHWAMDATDGAYAAFDPVNVRLRHQSSSTPTMN